MLERILLIGFGSAIGGIFRYLVSTGAYRMFGRGFPYGTFAVNAIGSLLVGFLFTILLERFDGLADQLRSLLIIGFLGGFTTFSSFSMETVSLMENGEVFTGLLNILVSVVCCLVLTWIGIALGRQL